MKTELSVPYQGETRIFVGSFENPNTASVLAKQIQEQGLELPSLEETMCLIAHAARPNATDAASAEILFHLLAGKPFWGFTGVRCTASGLCIQDRLDVTDGKFSFNPTHSRYAQRDSSEEVMQALYGGELRGKEALNRMCQFAERFGVVPHIWLTHDEELRIPTLHYSTKPAHLAINCTARPDNRAYGFGLVPRVSAAAVFAA